MVTWANTTLTWIDAEKFKSIIFGDKDVAQPRLRNLIPSKQEHFEAWNCFDCMIVTIDYSHGYG